MAILVVNCGSSTLKFHLFRDDPSSLLDNAALAAGIVERIGGRSRLAFEWSGHDLTREEPVADHAGAMKRVLDWLRQEGLDEISAAGHRVVHGGLRFTEPTLLNDDALAEIDRLTELAPLHNRPALEAIHVLRLQLGTDLPMVATFDTAFHAHMPQRAALYAFPLGLQERHGIRRYGFHGLAHRYMLERYAEIAGVAVDEPKLITLQLGAGCSATAIAGGRSVDTTMGFTPLEGLMMATRSGDVDPSLAGYIAERESVSIDEVTRILNEDSGLKGVSGASSDMRDLLEAEAAGDARAALAVEMFCYRVAKSAGAYLAALDGAGAIVFGGGIGENAADVRRRICKRLAWFGVSLDTEANGRAHGIETGVHDADSRVEIWVIPVNEARIIARDTIECLANSA